jgi:GalNAc5-diNAcBac-PP-undecaprenol beta-1,3-glucosyltransferase
MRKNNGTITVSIIIATYNRAKFIDLTLDSILNQSSINYEVIIVDDGGNDDTEEVLEPYLRDPRFKFYKRPLSFPKGCPGSRNFGLTKANGELIWFFDDDDIAHPDLLKNCISELENTELDFCRFERTVFYDFERIEFEENTQPKIDLISTKNLKQLIIGELPFNSCQVIWRKTSLGKEHFRGDIIYADDWEFYSRLLSMGLKGISIDKTLLFARKHSGSATYKYKTGNKKIISSVILANFSVIDIAIKENIFDKQLFTFFYKQAIYFNSFPIVQYLVKKSDINLLNSLKYRIGFYAYPALRPIFKLKSKLIKF